MRQEDLHGIEAFLKTPDAMEATKNVRTIAVLSPMEEMDLMRHMFPNAHVVGFDQAAWDLRNKYEHRGYDMIVICNTFLCSADVDLWFNNLYEGQPGSLILIQDLFKGWRGGTDGRATETGDLTRFHWTPHFKPSAEVSYDLAQQEGRMISLFSFDIDGGAGTRYVGLWR